jgi:hypothetical protein
VRKKKSVDPAWTIRLSSRNGSFEAAHEKFGGSGDRFDESPLSRAIDILEFCARIRQSPPPWAVRRWAENFDRGPSRKNGGKPRRSPVIDYIRALAVENCSGTRYRRDEFKDDRNNKYRRAQDLLRQTPTLLFCGLSVACSWQRIKASHLACADRKFSGPYQYLGMKDYLQAYLPLLVEALEQKDAPVRPFFW